MPEGSLNVEITELGSAVEGLLTLLGRPPEGDEPGSGLAGAAAVAEASPIAAIGEVAGDLEGSLGGLLQLPSTLSLGDLGDVLGGLDLSDGLEPTEALGGVSSLMTAAEGAVGSDLFSSITQLVATVRTLADGVPANRSDIFGPLVEQILEVLSGLEGEAGETLRAWVESVAAQQRELLPLLEAAAAGPPSSAALLEIFTTTFENVLEAFGARRLNGLFDFLDGGTEALVPRATLDSVGLRLDASIDALGAARAAVNAPSIDFASATAAASLAFADFKAEMRPVMGVLRRYVRHPLARPRGLETFLRFWMRQTLSVRVAEAQSIDNPFGEMFDRLDTAIDGLDLEAVRNEVLGFFATTRERLEEVDLGSVPDTLDEVVDRVDGVVRELTAGVDGLTATVGEHFDGLLGRQRQLLEQVGSFAADGTFRFDVEDQLREFLDGARLAIAGDPDTPGAASVAATLAEIQQSIDGFIRSLSEALVPVEDAATGARDAATAGIERFRGFLADLDVPALLETLRAEVEAIVEAILPIDFGDLVDPVVAELEASGERLAEIDPASLNDLLREALAAALDVVIRIDFSAEISAPLSDEFAAIKAIPQAAIDTLQERYEEAIAELDRLSPLQLVDALAEAFATIRNVVEAVDVAGLLAPLDDAHRRALLDPLDALRPSTLIEPLSTAFRERLAVIDELSGAALLAPLTEQLDRLRAAVSGIDLTGALDELGGALDGVKTSLESARPSALLEPLSADFRRLETRLDELRPSVLFGPVADLATPLLALLEDVQQEVVTGLHELFQAPLQLLDRLQPEALENAVREVMDAALDALRALDLPARFATLRGAHFDLMAEATAGGVEARVAIAASADPRFQLEPLVTEYQELVAELEELRDGFSLGSLEAIYEELRERLLALLPPFARELLDVETFQRVMRMASPLRFLEELDTRFETLRERLVPFRPEELGAELDETYEAVLALVAELDPGPRLDRLRDAVSGLTGAVDGIRLDFLAADLDAAVADLRATLEAVDPARLGAALDPLHDELRGAVLATVPSTLLAGLDEPLARIRSIVAALDPAAILEPARAAWMDVEALLGGVDFRVVLAPLVERLDELEASFFLGLERTEGAFDGMLGSARAALGGSGGASASASVSVGGSA